MRAVRTWTKTHPVISFYILSILFSWSYWLTLLAHGKRVEPGSSTTHLPGLMGPLMAAVLVTAVIGGRCGLGDLWHRATTLKPPYFRNALLALSPLCIAAVVFAVLVAMGEPSPPLHEFASYPGLPPGLPFWSVFLLVLVLNGYGEETGWRGFATHHLVGRFGKFRGTLLVSLMWLVWHAPLFWLNTNMQALIGHYFLGWALGLLCAAFLLSGIYLMTGHSILVVALWHTLYNFTVATPAGSGTPAAVISSIVMLWGAYFAIIWWRNNHSPNHHA